MSSSEQVPIPPPRESRPGETAPADKWPVTLARLTSILEHVTDFVLQIDEQGRITYINRIYPPYTREQVLGSQVEDWVTSEFRGRLRDAIARTLATGEPTNLEVAGAGKDGELAWYSTRMGAERVGGEIRSVVMITTDMTDRQRAVLTLRESEERFRQLATSIDRGFWLIAVDPERLLYVNPAFERIWGVPAGELYDRVRGGEMWIHPGDRQRVHERFNDWLAGLCDSFDMEYRIVRPSGETRWVHDLGAKIFAEQGKLIRASGVVRDITAEKAAGQELRDSEARYRLLADHSTDLISRHSPDGRWRYLSPASVAMLGYRPDELVGLDPFEFIHPDDRGMAMLALKNLVETGQNQTITYRARRADGRYVWLETIGKTVFDSGCNEVLEVVATSRDVTDRIEAARELRQREADLAHAERLSTMGQMASELAHELNQPLYAINNFAEASLGRLVQAGGAESPDLRRWLEQIAEQARRAGDVIRRITRFVRKGELDREPLDLNRCIRDLSVLLEFGSRGKGIHVSYELAERLPIVIADRVLIEQVLLNLVRNAAEAMEDSQPDSRRLTIRTFVAGEGDVGVTVSDTGSGIPPDCLERLFEPYFTTKADGTGMGLAICRSTIEAQGGCIWASNNPGGGATFSFTLPPAHPTQPD